MWKLDLENILENICRLGAFIFQKRNALKKKDLISKYNFFILKKLKRRKKMKKRKGAKMDA
jgi:hypothetical protein